MKKLIIIILLGMSFLISACTVENQDNKIKEVYDVNKIGKDNNYVPKENTNVIYLAGGCFWGVEKLVQSIPGVIEGVSGYANGTIEAPTYDQVKQGTTGFRETVRVEYDPSIVSLDTILYAYFSVVDPTVENRQGNDIGSQYQTGIYYTDEKSMETIRKIVEIEKQRTNKFLVEVKPLENFFEAEEYHQNYLDKNPTGYCHISKAEFERVKNMVVDASKYQKPSAEEISKNLTVEQYAVTQQAKTEKPYDNEYDEFFEEGIYVDVVTGEPLFTSFDKYDSGCGWPAFKKAIDENTIVEKEDTSFGMERIEIVSRVGNSHLGHKFENDPTSPNGVRYCINSASLRFIAKDDLEKEGYGEYLELFK